MAESEMIERVARAICRAEYGPGDAGWENQIPAARAAIEAMPGWRHIDTAPRDGTEILAYAADKSINGHYYGVAMWAEKSEWPPNSVAGWFWTYRARPSHWMPLPAPPDTKD